MKHLKDYFEIASEQKSVFSNEKVSALVAKPGTIYTASAGRQLSVFHHYALMARCWKTIFNKIWERTFQIEYGCAFLHHLSYRITALGFFLFTQSQFLCVGIRRMEIEGYRTNVFSITGSQTHVSYIVFVDLIDSHIESDIVCGGIADVLHDSIVGVTTDFIMALFISVQAQKNQIRFREINGEGSV